MAARSTFGVQARQDPWVAAARRVHLRVPKSDWRGTITACVTSVQNTDAWAKAGVMIRETLQPNSTFAAAYVTPSNGIAAQWRASSGGQCDHRQTSGSAPGVGATARAGSTFTVHTSVNGTNWTPLTSFTVAMNSNVVRGPGAHES